MKQNRLILFACIVATAVAFGCARKQTRNLEKIRQHIAKIQENNKKACIEGCLVFEGDSNVELTDFQCYFNQPACNLAYRGSTSEDVLKRKEKVRRLQPVAIVLLVGGNDLLKMTPQEKIGRNYAEIIGYYRSFCRKVYCISNLPVNPKIIVTNMDIQRLNALLERTCRRGGAIYVNVYPSLFKDGGLNPNYAIDPVHLNKTGQDVLAGILKKYMGR
ncbi:MAG: hypothetical protein JW807_08115 [Spirochaetes bacterium]|nr:hypothetical protein [Spirochaetota bacterium]